MALTTYDQASAFVRFAFQAHEVDDDVIADPLCEDYCATVELNCTEDNAITWTVDCLTDCGGWPEGADGDTAVNTTHCRLYHAGVAADDPALHCPHASPDGGDVCVDAP